jgi:FkbM family methyltransferase
MRKLKLLAARLLLCTPVSYLIRCLSKSEIIFFGIIRIETRSSAITNRIFAALYFNLYERAEALFISKHLSNETDVIELGSSIGVISSLIGKVKGHSKKMVCIEANPIIIPICVNNLELNQIGNAYVRNYGIGLKGSQLFFHEGISNIHGYLSERDSSNFPVEVKSLSDIIEEFEIISYTLVCDIEGAEVDILLNDPSSLKRCNCVIIELHEVMREGYLFRIDEIKQMIISCGFRLVDYKGDNYVFKR